MEKSANFVSFLWCYLFTHGSDFRTGVLGQKYEVVTIVSIKAHIFVVIFSQVRALYPLNTNWTFNSLRYPLFTLMHLSGFVRILTLTTGDFCYERVLPMHPLGKTDNSWSQFPAPSLGNYTVLLTRVALCQILKNPFLRNVRKPPVYLSSIWSQQNLAAHSLHLRYNFGLGRMRFG